MPALHRLVQFLVIGWRGRNAAKFTDKWGRGETLAGSGFVRDVFLEFRLAAGFAGWAVCMIQGGIAKASAALGAVCRILSFRSIDCVCSPSN